MRKLVSIIVIALYLGGVLVPGAAVLGEAGISLTSRIYQSAPLCTFASDLSDQARLITELAGLATSLSPATSPETPAQGTHQPTAFLMSSSVMSSSIKPMAVQSYTTLSGFDVFKIPDKPPAILLLLLGSVFSLFFMRRRTGAFFFLLPRGSIDAYIFMTCRVWNLIGFANGVFLFVSECSQVPDNINE